MKVIGAKPGDLPLGPVQVSILVLVDEGHRPRVPRVPRRPDHLVSILVLVDEGHRQPAAGGGPRRHAVSILVLVDEGHRQR